MRTVAQRSRLRESRRSSHKARPRSGLLDPAALRRTPALPGLCGARLRLACSAPRAFPFLAKVPSATFLKAVSVAEISVGAALLTPIVPNKVAAAVLTAFAGGPGHHVWDQALAAGGVAGLVPARRGPKGASKLTPRLEDRQL